MTLQIYESEPLQIEAGECKQASASDHIYRGRFGAVWKWITKHKRVYEQNVFRQRIHSKSSENMTQT